MVPQQPFSEADIRDSAIRDLLRNVNMKFLPEFVENRMDDAIAEFIAESERSRHLFAFVERGGWYAADRFIAWLQAKLDTGPWKGSTRIL